MHGTTNSDDKVPIDEQYDGGDVLPPLHKELEGKLTACRNMSLHGPYNVNCIHSTKQGSIYKYVDMLICPLQQAPQRSHDFLCTPVCKIREKADD